MDRRVHTAADTAGDSHVGPGIVPERIIPAERGVIQAVGSEHLVGGSGIDLVVDGR
jgi:hypothetical protein